MKPKRNLPRPPGPRFKWPHSPGIWVAMLLAVLLSLRSLRPTETPPPFPEQADAVHLVQRVVDGDTLLLGDRNRVRLLGVDTPETKHPDLPVDPLGLEAAEFTRKMVEGRLVQLQFDRERRDRFHRLLAYVFIDGRMLNEELIRAGYSRAETQYPYSESMKRRFRAAEDEARQAGRGMWAEETR